MFNFLLRLFRRRKPASNDGLELVYHPLDSVPATLVLPLVHDFCRGEIVKFKRQVAWPVTLRPSSLEMALACADDVFKHIVDGGVLLQYTVAWTEYSYITRFYSVYLHGITLPTTLPLEDLGLLIQILEASGWEIVPISEQSTWEQRWTKHVAEAQAALLGYEDENDDDGSNYEADPEDLDDDMDDEEEEDFSDEEDEGGTDYADRTKG